jgi:hypothetical protein
MRAACFLLLCAFAAAAHPPRPQLETVLDEDVGVGPLKIRTLDLPLSEAGVRIIVQYDVIRGMSGVRLLLMTREHAARWSQAQPHLILAGTGYGFSGALTHTLPQPGHYQLVLDNLSESRAEARIRLRVRLLRNGGAAAAPYGPEPWRARAAVWGSAAAFLAILLIGGLRLKRALELRQARLRAGYL